MVFCDEIISPQTVTFLWKIKTNFSFLVTFLLFQAVFRIGEYILAKYGQIVYIKNYQRLFKILSKKCSQNFFDNSYMYPKSIFLLSFVVRTSIYSWQKLVFKFFFWNMQILCYFSYKWHCSHHRDPCKVSLAFYGFLEFFKHINNDDLNFPCWASSL